MSSRTGQSKHGRVGSIQHMSSIRNAQMTNGSNHRLSALRSTQIIDSKAALPAELITVILDHVSVPDLMRCARVSTRFQEMVYDDTRWVQRLRLMGVWNEQEARKQFEEAMRKKSSRQPALFDAEEEKKRSDGFSEITIPSHTKLDPLRVLSQVRSIRGRARQEFARVYQGLAPYYIDLINKDKLIFRTFQTPEDQASMLAALSAFAKQDPSHRTELVSLIDVFQQAVLREFQHGVQADDMDGRMVRYSRVLTLLGRTEPAIDLYISAISELDPSHRASKPLLCLEDVAVGHVDMNPCNRYFELLSTTSQWQIVRLERLFPRQGLHAFLEKLWRAISAYSTTLFDEAHRLGGETYCRAVAGTFSDALRLVADIQPLSTIPMKDMLRSTFEQHLDLYFAEELSRFKNKSDSEVAEWEKQLVEQQMGTESYFMSNVSRQAAKRDFLSSFRKVVMLPVTAFPIASPFAAKPKIEESRAPTPSLPSRTSTPRPEAPTSELAAKTAVMNSRLENIKGLFSLQVAINLTQYAKTSLERIALFVQVSDQARVHCVAVFVQLLRILGTRHVQHGFDKALEHLSDYDPRQVREYRNSTGDVQAVEPLVTFLELVNVGDLIQQMVDVFYTQELIAPRLTDRDDFRDPAVMEKKAFEQMLDSRVASGLNKGIDVLMSEVEFMCTSQPTTDFNPVPVMRDNKWSQPDIDINVSDTAEQVIKIVSGHTQMLVGSTDKSMLDVFMQEVATRLFGVVCKHVKRHRISVTGSIKLISDLNHYAAFISGLRQKPVLPYAAVLKEIGQIYLIHIDPPSGGGLLASKLSKTQQQCKELATIIADTNRYNGILPVEEVYEFAERRADWHIVKSDVDRAMYGVGCSIM